MPKISQILAIEKAIKQTSQKKLTEVYHTNQKPGLFAGISRTYQPDVDGAEQLPSEFTKVQVTAEVVLNNVKAAITDLLNVTATKDYANCNAYANVTVDGVTLLEQVPVTYLIFLEKQLADLRTTVNALPTLEASENWKKDPNRECYVSDVVQTARTKKTQKVIQKAPATDKHPAQVEIFPEDVKVGNWTTTKLSGAIPPSELNQITSRIDKLSQAVKFAREEANTTEVVQQKVADTILGYVFD